MALSRKSAVVIPAAVAAPRRFPRRIVVFVIVRDESGSMSPYREAVGTFLPAVTKSLTAAGGAKVADLIYVLYVVVSGGVRTAGFAPLSEIAEPAFERDGYTPMGQAFTAGTEKIAGFLADVFAAETSIKAFEILVVSDLKPTGETAEQTEAGVVQLLEVAKTYRAGVTIVGPKPEEMNHELAKRLDVGERGIRYLDSDPSAVIKVTFDSLLSASRVLTGSKPLTRNT